MAAERGIRAARENEMTDTPKLRSGTRVEISAIPRGSNAVWLPARIDRVQRFMRPMPEGYHPVTFVDGSKILVHESRIRVAA